VKKISFLIFFLFLFAAFIACQAPKKETPTRGSLEILTSESHASLMMQEAAEFQRLYTEATITITATTTRDAIVQLLNDSVTTICIDRPLNPEELAVAEKAMMKLTTTKIAKDALAIFVNKENPIRQISIQSLTDITTGRAVDWQQVPESQWSNGKIQLALTGRNSGLYELLISHFLKISTEPAISFLAENQNQVLDFVISHPNAIGVASVPVVHDTTRFNNSIQLLNVEATDSTNTITYVRLHQANIYRETYPFNYPIFMYSTTAYGSLTTGFTSFVASASGQKIILNAGLVPATMPVRLVQLK